MSRHLTPIEHGTDSGYFKHRRRGEDSCGACNAAHSLAARRHPRVVSGPSQDQDGRCVSCGYRVTAFGHKITCEGS